MKACPTPEILTTFTLGEPFDAESVAGISAHVDGCPQCLTFVGGVVEKTLEWARPEPTEAELVTCREIEERWQDFVARFGKEQLGIGEPPEGRED